MARRLVFFALFAFVLLAGCADIFSLDPLHLGPDAGDPDAGGVPDATDN